VLPANLKRETRRSQSIESSVAPLVEVHFPWERKGDRFAGREIPLHPFLPFDRELKRIAFLFQFNGFSTEWDYPMSRGNSHHWEHRANC
jgi:hypothetical protein